MSAYNMMNSTLPWTLGGPRDTCPAELKCLEWAHRFFGDCVCSARDEVSFALGMMSVVSWAVAEVPQIITNFFAGGTEGVSLTFLMTWTVGDVFNLAGCYLEPATLPTQYYMAVMYTITTIVLVAQTVYYEVLVPRNEMEIGAGEGEEAEGLTAEEAVAVRGATASSSGSGADAITTPLLPGIQPSAPISLPIPAAARSEMMSVPLTRKSSHRDIHIHSARSLVASHTPTMGSFLPHSHHLAGSQPQPHRIHHHHTRNNSNNSNQQHHVGSLLSQSPGQGAPHISLHNQSPVTRAVAFGVLFFGCVRIGSLCNTIINAAPYTDFSSSSLSSPFSTPSSVFPASSSSPFDPSAAAAAAVLPPQVFPMRRRLLQVTPHALFSEHPSLRADGGGDDEPSALGELLGWLMAAIYMGGRIPQIYLNMQRGTVEGLSPLMFLFALVGNATYVGSILVRSMEWRHLKPNLPWLVDAAVCVLLDLFILCQFVYYTYRPSNEEAAEDEEESK